jgi:hypothetical protein
LPACRAIWGVGMLRLAGAQVESLFDEALPVEVRELPGDLARLDLLLADERLLGPIERAWRSFARGGPAVAVNRADGRAPAGRGQGHGAGADR